jgi:hypothetical protein
MNVLMALPTRGQVAIPARGTGHSGWLGGGSFLSKICVVGWWSLCHSLSLSARERQRERQPPNQSYCRHRERRPPNQPYFRQSEKAKSRKSVLPKNRKIKV